MLITQQENLRSYNIAYSRIDFWNKKGPGVREFTPMILATAYGSSRIASYISEPYNINIPFLVNVAFPIDLLVLLETRKLHIRLVFWFQVDSAIL